MGHNRGLTTATHIMLDSGAFSAWNSGAVVDIKAYAKFIKEVPFIDAAISLDVIPGVRGGGPPTTTEIEKAAQASWKNYQWLISHKVDVIPVFHYGESWSWLDRIVESGAVYIGLGAIARVGRAGRIDWLDEVFTRLTNRSGVPYVKTHGFGVTDFNILARYPWYSCDSMSWIFAGGFGQIKVAGSGVSVSDRIRSNHITCLPELEQEVVEEYCEQFGISRELLSTSRDARIELGARYLASGVDAIEVGPFQHRTPTLLSGRTKYKRSPLKLWKKILLYYGGEGWEKVLHGLELNYRLVSYARNSSVAWLREYAALGLRPKKQKE